MNKKVLIKTDSETATIEIYVDDVRVFNGNYSDFSVPFDIALLMKTMSNDVTFINVKNK